MLDIKTRRKRFLLLSEIHEGGEWIASQRLVSAANRYFCNLEFSLIGFINDKITIPNLFKKTVFIPHSTASAPFSFIKKLIFDFFKARNELKKVISKNNFDYFLATYYFMVLPAKSLSSVRKGIIIYYFHGTRSVSFKKISDFNYRQLIIKLLELLSLLSADIIIIPSKEAEHFVRKMLGVFSIKKNFFFIPNSVPSDFFKTHPKIDLIKFKKSLQIPFNALVVSYCGRMAKYKGLENLVEAFNKLVWGKRNLYLVIAYPTNNQDKSVLKILKQKIRRAKTQKYIKLVKNLKQNKLIALYQISDLTILPSEIEMAPLVLIESLACGTPFLGTKTGNMPYLLNKIDPFLILDNNSPKEIYKKLIYYFTLPKDSVEKMKKKSLEISNQYTEEASAQKFIKLIDSIDNSAPAS